MSEELKPCPFILVQKDIGHNLWYSIKDGNIQCSCGAQGPIGAYTKETAVDAWNRRQEAKPLTKCPDCGGSGGIASHHWQCDGNCGPECPVLEPCERCQGTGEIAVQPLESERIRDLEERNKFLDLREKQRCFPDMFGNSCDQKTIAALESKIAMVEEFAYSSNMTELIEILETKDE